MAQFSERELFETVPVPRAVATLAIPTAISQVVTMIYNLADTFFIGQTGDPLMVAAVSLVSPWFNLLTALGNLFGLGGSSLISRMLGVQREGEIRYVSSFSIWAGAVVTACFSLVSFLAREPLLTFLGASVDNYRYAEDYLLWVVATGGVPTMVSLALGHLLRSEGHAREASAGMMFGGVLNVILDPVLIFGFQLEVAGAAIATAFSNAASVVFFAVQYARLKGRTAVSFRPRYFTFRYVGQIFSVGLASALATALGNASNMVMVHLASGYGDIPVAAYGVVKRIDQFPLNVSMGLCQGFMSLVGYNYAARNYGRMRAVSYFSWKVALIFSACCVACFAVFAPQILYLFIPEAETSALGTSFLRVACLAVPLTAVNFLISYTLQAMGKGVQSAILTDQEKWMVAYHEVGHALVAALQTHSAPVQKITIIPRTSGALGYTMQVEEGNHYLMSQEELENRIATFTGGRAAEELIFHSASTGASNDIEQATKLARAMITRYGMSKDFDMVALETVTNQYLGGDTSLACSAETAAEIDKQVVALVRSQHEKASKLLEENLGKLHELSKYLYEKETITGDEFMEILNR